MKPFRYSVLPPPSLLGLDATYFAIGEVTRGCGREPSTDENVRCAWNAGPGSKDWETFRKRHTENVAVYWPGQPEPTRGRHNHDSEAVEFFKIFLDNHLVNNPYKILFGQGDYTCSVAEFTGTMKGPMKGADGKMIPPPTRNSILSSAR